MGPQRKEILRAVPHPRLGPRRPEDARPRPPHGPARKARPRQIPDRGARRRPRLAPLRGEVPGEARLPPRMHAPEERRRTAGAAVSRHRALGRLGGEDDRAVRLLPRRGLLRRGPGLPALRLPPGRLRAHRGVSARRRSAGDPAAPAPRPAAHDRGALRLHRRAIDVRLQDVEQRPRLGAGRRAPEGARLPRAVHRPRPHRRLGLLLEPHPARRRGLHRRPPPRRARGDAAPRRLLRRALEAWAAGTPVVLVSGFSLPTCEFFTPYRVHNTHVCHGCWDAADVVFDRRDFFWCPRHKGTDRQFECTRAITGRQVIRAIERLRADHRLSAPKERHS